MRLFAGIEFDREIKNEISRVQETLKKLCASGRWKREDNFHLTLKFLGEVAPDKLPGIFSALERAATGTSPFSLKISNLGQFKGRDTIRVLWLGTEGDTDVLEELKEKIEVNMSDIGFGKDLKKFSPHITIAQDVNAGCTFAELRNAITPLNIPAINVKDIVLFKSEQIAGKRVYTPVRRFALTQGRITPVSGG